MTIKFNIGEKVVFTDGVFARRIMGNSHYHGKVYTVKDVQRFNCLNDDVWLDGMTRTATNGIDASHLTYAAGYAPSSVATPNEGKFIVITEIDSKLAPASTPKEYDTIRQAKYVADDMAKRHGGKFFVFRAVYESSRVISQKDL